MVVMQGTTVTFFLKRLRAPKFQLQLAHAFLPRRLRPAMTEIGGGPLLGHRPLIASHLTTMVMVSFPGCLCYALAILKTLNPGALTQPA